MTATLNSHSAEFRQAQHDVLRGSDIVTRTIDVDGDEVHVLERGRGSPVLVLHGTGAGASFMRPLLDRLDGVRVVAPDRPGQGLSEPAGISRGDVRTRATTWIDHLLDVLECQRVTIVGHSMGGLWALWYALTFPQRVTRLVLLAPPQLPGTRCPVPYRVMGTPGLFRLLQRLSPPSRATSLRFATLMGEGDTIADQPDLLDLMTTSGKDPTTVRTNVAEARTIVSPFALITRTGFRRSMRLRVADLRRLDLPTLLIWGDREPLGSVDVATELARLIPRARLAVVPGGHAPWIGRAELTAGIVNRFVDDAVDHAHDALDDAHFDPSTRNAEMGIAPDAPADTPSVPSNSRRHRGGVS